MEGGSFFHLCVFIAGSSRPFRDCPIATARVQMEIHFHLDKANLNENLVLQHLRRSILHLPPIE